MNTLTRRSFLKTGAAGALGFSLMPMLKGCGTGANDTIRVGFIGLGRQTVHLSLGFNRIEGVKVVAGCDVYGRKRERFERQILSQQEELEQTPEMTTYADYRDLLARDDIDAVAIVTPDHWHAIMAIDACRAGKDIYLEKPLTFTIHEGKELVKAVRAHNRVLGVGSQQRSDPTFQHAVRLVQRGRLGDLSKVHAWVGGPAVPYDLPEQPVPADLDWDMWLGPNPYVHYHPDLNPPIQLDPRQDEQLWGAWRWYKETGGGALTDWGAHNFDIAQWALNMDNSGPVEVMPAGHYDPEYIAFRYENGLVMLNKPFTEDQNYGVRFESNDAWIEVHRGAFRASDPSLMPGEDDEQDDGLAYESGVSHLDDFIDAMRTRRDPIAPVEAGHRSGTLGILGNIATELDRSLRWDPVAERFVTDPVADRLLHREYRPGYSL